MKGRARTIPLHRLVAMPLAPGLATLAYITSAGADAGVYAQTMMRPLIIGLIAAIIITTVAVVLTRSKDAGGAAAVVALLLMWSGGAVGTVVTRTPLWQAALWLGLVALAAALVVRIMLRRAQRHGLVPTSQTLNIVGGLLLAVVVVSGVANGRAAQLIGDLTPGGYDAEPTSEQDDIIILILDGYPRADTLARLFEHDNGPFLEALEKNGLSVADEARANYAWTELTLLSMLHMQPAQDVAGFARVASGDVKPQPALRELTITNPVFDHLRSAGYTVTTVAPAIDHVALRQVEVSHVPPGASDFEIHLMGSTVIAGAIALVDPAFFARNQRNQVLWGLDTFETVATQDPGGRLILGHVLSPHMPAVFRSDGSLRPVPFDHRFFLDFRVLAGVPRDEWIAQYREQVEYLNQRVIQLVDRVTVENPTATVIIMSDHGSGSEFDATTRGGEVEERYGILFAARTPGHERLFATDQTPVNIFAPMLDQYLGIDVPRQPDTSYLGYLELAPLQAPE